MQSPPPDPRSVEITMPTFTITGDIDPFLHVSLRKGEKIYCESNAMVMMEATLDLQGRMTGGLGRALMRRLTSGESFFQQHIEAVRGDGDCLLSPMLPGAMQMLEVGPRRYTLNDGAFVAGSGFGSIFVLDVEPGKDVIIDNAHVVAWDSSLRYEISVTTGNSSGLLGNLVNSVTSGEGIV